MTPRERMLTALNNGTPDRLPSQVHAWMSYYLNTYLKGMDQWQAYEYFDMDYAIYLWPQYKYSDRSLGNWQVKTTCLGKDGDGTSHYCETITTPDGELTRKYSTNIFTSWDTEHIVKDKRDFEIWAKHCPLPTDIDVSGVAKDSQRLGEKGIIRCRPHYFNQGSPWQCYCTMAGTQEAIMTAVDEPDYLHACLDTLLKRSLRVIGMWDGLKADVIETGGGAGSNTVISPALFREFCLPYDKIQNEAMHQLGMKVVYHLCGGVMQMLELVVESGADGLETMTPPEMGGDCNLSEASKRVGDRLFFIGGFDQNRGFEKGTPEQVRRMVFECFEATRDHAGYIISPSDHFFFGNPENIRAFSETVKECKY